MSPVTGLFLSGFGLGACIGSIITIAVSRVVSARDRRSLEIERSWRAHR